MPSIINELNPPRTVYLTLAQNLGLAVGAAGWGVGSDVIGRRWAFNLTVRSITAHFSLVSCKADIGYSC